MANLNIYTNTTRPADAVYVGTIQRDTKEKCIAYAAQHWTTYKWEFDGENRAPLRTLIII